MNLEESYFAPTIFLNHGSGPNPVYGLERDEEIATHLRNLNTLVPLNKLRAIIMVSAHREEDIVTISSGTHYDMVYDYSNFPPETYEYKHNGTGDPILARKIHKAFAKAGIVSQLDEKRGWDHGLFVPMMLADPDAKIPIVQVSVLKNQNARDHFEIGKVLYQFRKYGIAIIGSGMSYHNLPMFIKTDKDNDGIVVNDKFDRFLNDVCTGTEAKEDILNWEQAPQARDCHPLNQAHHFMPLIVCVGGSGSHVGKNVFSTVYSKKFLLSGFMWDKEF